MKKINIKKFFLIFFIFFLILLTIFMIILTLYIIYLSKILPKWDMNSFNINNFSTIYDENNNEITNNFSNENKILISYDKIPKMYIDSIVATEDSDFYSHKGFSIKGVIRSIIINIFSRSKSQGGSTITQQLARGVLLSQKEAINKSYTRKIKEILLAMQIEDKLTKEEILEHYINMVYFGHNAYGLEAASLTYFNKNSTELTDSEITLLAGLPQSPSYYDPYINLEAALKRKSTVIDRMVKTKKITKEYGDLLKNTPIILQNGYEEQKNNSNNKYNYFVDAVIIEAEKILKEKNLENLYKGGYKIYTTMNPIIQSNIETVYNNNENFPEEMNGEKPESAMIVINHTNGEIKGLIGGREYKTIKCLNRALKSKRQPGSTFKLISVYAPGFEKGIISPSTILDDSPYPMIKDYEGKNYPLINYDNLYHGKMSVRTAIKKSINTIPIKILNEISPTYGYEFAKRIGIENIKAKEKHNLSQALGGLEEGITPLELARAYGTFANKGKLNYNTLIRKIINSYGETIYEYIPKNQPVISEEVAYLVTDCLKSIIDSGFCPEAYINGLDVAGKTGTTDMITSDNINITEGNKDIWFVGYTPTLTGSVWIGFDKSDQDHYLNRNYSSNMCANIWRQVISSSINNYENLKFEKPDGIEELFIDENTGLPSNINTGSSDIFIKNLTNKNINLNLESFIKNILSLKNIFYKNNYAKLIDNEKIYLSWKKTKNNQYTIEREVDGEKIKIGESNTNYFTDNFPPLNKSIIYIITDSNGNEIQIFYTKEGENL